MDNLCFLFINGQAKVFTGHYKMVHAMLHAVLSRGNQGTIISEEEIIEVGG